MSTAKNNPIVLKLPKPAALLIVFGRHVVQAMTISPWFPSPTPSLPTVTTNLDTLEVAEVAVLTRAKGTVEVRDLARKAVESNLWELKSYVQGIVNQSKEAAAIIVSAGMSPRQPKRGEKPELEARMGPSPGEAIVRAKAIRKSAAYEWQWSSDGGKTWDALGTTTVANKGVVGLTIGSTYLFRFRATVKETTGDWSTPVSLFAHPLKGP